MASNKDSLVMIVDVGIGAEQLTEETAQICMDVLKHKMFYNKLDLVTLLLFRTEDTDNVGHSEQPGDYLNIYQVMPSSQIANWKMGRDFMESLQMKKSIEGDWLDALIVALKFITDDESIHKTKTSKIVFFHNFDSPVASWEEKVLEKLKEVECQLVIVSQNVHYVRDRRGNLQAEFKDNTGKSLAQEKNEELAMKFVKGYRSTTLCNLKDAFPIIVLKKQRSPWTWNTSLTIGTKINVLVSGAIAIKKNDKFPSFQRITKDAHEVIAREKKFYVSADELSSEKPIDCVTGYMLGNTPVPYDPTLGQTPNVDTKKGVHFIGFVPIDNIPQEHFSGLSTYVLFPQKEKCVSAKIMDSLVRVMLTLNMSILAWKVYLNGHKPKLVILLPTLDYEVPGLSVIELSYHSQHHFWDFPKLTTRKNEATPEQIAAIDELMDKMDLSPEGSVSTAESERLHQDRLPFETLPNLHQQYLIDFLASVSLNQTFRAQDIPHVFDSETSATVEKIKKLFPLEKIEPSTKEKLKKYFNQDADEEMSAAVDVTSITKQEDAPLTHVGTVTPAEDFDTLITERVSKLPAGAERTAKFHQYASQVGAVIKDLLLKTMVKPIKKITAALLAYRRLAQEEKSHKEFNEFMWEFRAHVIERKLFSLWDDVIIKHQIGLLEEDDSLDRFYNPRDENLFEDNEDNAQMDDDSVDDLLDNI